MATRQSCKRKRIDTPSSASTPSHCLIYVKSLTGKIHKITVEGSRSQQPLPKRKSHLPQDSYPESLWSLSDITSELILGSAQGTARKALASALAEFWVGDSGKAVYGYLLRERKKESSVDRRSLTALEAEGKNWEVLQSILEFSRFILLKAARMDYQVPYELSPPREVDEVWHSLLLFPRAYNELCKTLLGDDGIIDHDPRKSAQSVYDARYLRTYEHYTKTFRVQPSAWWWPEPEEWQRNSQPSSGFTVLNLKEELQRDAGIPKDQQMLIFAGRQLQDERTLVEYGIGPGSTVYLILRLSGC
mmetsp:Transcript_31840/g.74402  ORF Transcript_31840/g.74402 Transcript_31840/m.74402 type:complete len:303 (+) Transcript_31840:49-957(+)